MKEFIEKLIGRLEDRIKYNELCHKEFPNAKMSLTYEVQINAYKNAIEIVNELAEEYKDKDCSKCSRRSWYQIGYADAEKKFAEEYKGGWISVNDRLPTKEGSYLVVGKTGGATVTRWYTPSKFYPNGHFGGNSARYIRYWMPRPQAPLDEPYKGE